jgi:hypothetical protein
VSDGADEMVEGEKAGALDEEGELLEQFASHGPVSATRQRRPVVGRERREATLAASQEVALEARRRGGRQ